MNTVFRVVALLAVSCLPCAALAGDASRPAPELLLQLDFFGVEGATVPDGSGRGHDARLERGQLVEGRGKPALRLDGEGVLTIAAASDLAGASALTIGSMCRPDAADGVIAAWGDERDGFTLSLQAGVPVFAVRSAGVVREARSDEPLELGRWAHLAGVVAADGHLSLLVDTWPVADAPAAPRLAVAPAPAPAPAAALLIGGTANGQPGFRGLLQDVRLYGGAVSRDTDRELLAEWANRPGCGCRK